MTESDTTRFDKFDMELSEFKTILIRIEKRLTGDMASNEPGLLEDVRTLKKDVQHIETNIQHINTAITAIQGVNAQQHINNLNGEVSVLKEKIDKLYKEKYVFYGICLVIIFFAEKLTGWFLGKV